MKYRGVLGGYKELQIKRKIDNLKTKKMQDNTINSLGAKLTIAKILPRTSDTGKDPKMTMTSPKVVYFTAIF